MELTIHVIYRCFLETPDYPVRWYTFDFAYRLWHTKPFLQHERGSRLFVFHWWFIISFTIPFRGRVFMRSNLDQGMFISSRSVWKHFLLLFKCIATWELLVFPDKRWLVEQWWLTLLNAISIWDQFWTRAMTPKTVSDSFRNSSRPRKNWNSNATGCFKEIRRGSGRQRGVLSLQLISCITKQYPLSHVHLDFEALRQHKRKWNNFADSGFRCNPLWYNEDTKQSAPIRFLTQRSRWNIG